VGLRDILTGRHQVSGPAPDKLFAISTGYVALQTECGLAPTGKAAIVFQPLATGEFEATMRDMEEVVRATGGESGTQVASQNDSYGYRWMIVNNPPGHPSVEDLAVAINAVSDSIEGAGHGERLLCAVFAFAPGREAGDEGGGGTEGDAGQAGGGGDGAGGGSEIYFIYNYKRGFWYPFVPASGSEQRSTERELQLKAQMARELPIEPELERWFPLWGIPI
jgi:hypothetical protein